MCGTYRADTGDCGHTILLRSLQQLEGLDAGAYFEYGARVVLTLIVLYVLDLFQSMSPDAKCTLAD